MEKDLSALLSAPFDDGDLEWRLQWVNDGKTSGTAVPYVTNRAIQARLDAAVGIGGWKNEYIPWHSDGKKQSQLCGISVYLEDKKEWITKYDGAEDSDIEPVKGGLSDSMKRAAVQWGLGRYLYEMDSVFVDVETRGRTAVIKRGEYSKLNEAHQKAIAKVFGKAYGKPETAAPAEEAPRAVASRPEPAERGGVYRVLSAVPQKGVSGGSTHLQLRSQDGKVIKAYMRGTDQGIAPGIWIRDAVVTMRLKEGIAYNTLDSYSAYHPDASKAA
jgi:hypothetical protein